MAPRGALPRLWTSQLRTLAPQFVELQRCQAALVALVGCASNGRLRRDACVHRRSGLRAAGRCADPYRPDCVGWAREMAKLIYAALTSLDGYVMDEQGIFECAEPDEEAHASINDLRRSVGTYVYGRRVYETMAGESTPPSPPGAR